MAKLKCPLPGNPPVTQAYGDNPGAYAYPCRPDYSHAGIDWACVEGTPVFAAADGTVVRAGMDSTGYGILVKLSHGWCDTLYAHLSARICDMGQVVKAGQMIAYSGNTGSSSGPHLHFEVHIPPGGTCMQAVDPVPYLMPSAAPAVELSPVDEPGAEPKRRKRLADRHQVPKQALIVKYRKRG